MGLLLTVLPLLCMHNKRAWIFSNLGSLRMPCPILSAICGMAEVTNLPSSILVTLPVHGFIMTVVDAQKDLSERLSWVSLSPESSICVSTRTTTSREPASMVENMPGPKVSCTILWGLGIFARRMSPPASDSSLGSMTKTELISFLSS